MEIYYDAILKIFKLDSHQVSYVMQILDGDILAHLYFGSYIKDFDLSYLIRLKDRGFSGNPAAAKGNRGFSMDTLPQEMGSFDVGDYRTASVILQLENGSTATDMRYKSHSIMKGKPGLPGLAATYASEEEAMTLIITMEDSVSGVECDLYYSVFQNYSALTRSIRIRNTSSKTVKINQVLSMSLDLDRSDFDMISLYGRWASERHIERARLHHGKQSIGSLRGASSHHYNPFTAVVEHGSNEVYGACYGFSLVYSGNFLAEGELTQTNDTRFVMGIHPANFGWTLTPESEFVAPEVVMVYSNAGLGAMSHTFHKLFRQNLCRGEYKDRPRPILINNWEATYFDFTKEKLLDIAKSAKELGIEMLVVDDGWFGDRQSDTTSLGDWEVNEQKMGGSLTDFVEEVNQIGLKVGLWFEPEMISEQSGLYQLHPDWCLQIPGRHKQESRSQLVLDMSRQDIRDYLFAKISKILAHSNIEYVKWDMNRHLTEVWSAQLPPDRQQECSHRFVLGVYDLFERLTGRFPHIIFEGCSGGGGRFDPGMLFYCPQHWTSDNTDPIERLQIQEGTSLVYPLSAMAAHVSASPNHQTGRFTSIETRGVVALTGAFGYELDLTTLSEAEKTVICSQISDYKKYQRLVSTGLYYRHLSAKDHGAGAWSFVDQEQTQVLFSFVQVKAAPNALFVRVPLRGLKADNYYEDQSTGQRYRGDVLMAIGLCIPELKGDGGAYVCHLVRVD